MRGKDTREWVVLRADRKKSWGQFVARARVRAGGQRVGFDVASDDRAGDRQFGRDLICCGEGDVLESKA